MDTKAETLFMAKISYGVVTRFRRLLYTVLSFLSFFSYFFFFESSILPLNPTSVEGNFIHIVQLAVCICMYKKP